MTCAAASLYVMQEIEAELGIPTTKFLDQFQNAWKLILGRETQILGEQHRVWVVAASFNQTFALDVGPGGGTLQVDWKEEITL